MTRNMNLNKILGPIDGSKKSFDAPDGTLTLAESTPGRVVGIHVIPRVMDGGSRTKSFDRHLQEDAKIILKKAEKRAGNKNVKSAAKTLRGSSGHVTLHTAETGKFDHIVTSTTGTGTAASKDVAGSVSNHVLHKSNSGISDKMTV